MKNGVECRACGAQTKPLWRGRLITHDVQYFECPSCRYVQTEEPHWLSEAYDEVINQSDTGIMSRNIANAQLVIGALWLLKHLDGSVVDCAGGYGILVRLLRDEGVDALWSDPFCENLVARGFEHRQGNAFLVTAFEAFEHFVHPDVELGRMLAIAPNVLISTMLLPTPTPAHEDWWYYGREHGQHVGLFRAETLRVLAARHGKHLATDGVSNHLFSERPVSDSSLHRLVRHRRLAHWLARRKLSSRTWSDHLAMSASVAK
jgi:hypothetical protein